MDEVKLAKLFHQVYEDLAPSFGYGTRTDTKEFDENSKNGKLMIATCKAILPEIKASQFDALVSLQTADLATEVKNDIEQRIQKGVETYGERLKTNNGRIALQDAYEEILDLALYIKQELKERESSLSS